MKKTILMVIAIIGILGCCTTINAENIIDLGMLNYDDGYEFTLYVNINSTQPVDLQFITSEMNESYVEVINNGFYSIENKTLYHFIAKKIMPDFWFIPEIKEYYYIDNTTKQLYRLSVNYSNADVPENPYKLMYINSEENCNRSSLELYNISLKLENISNQYNQTKKDLDEKIIKLTNLQDSYDSNENKWKENQLEIQNMSSELSKLQEEYDKTYTLFISVSRNASTYRMNWNDVAHENEELKGTIGALYFYIILAIILTVLIIWLFFRMKYKIITKEDPMNVESDTGYTTEAGKVDGFFLGKTVRGLKELGKRVTGNTTKTIQNNPMPVIDNNHGEIDTLKERLDTFETKYTKDIQEIHAKIDSLTFLPEGK